MPNISRREKAMCIGKVKHKSELAANTQMERSMKSIHNPNRRNLNVYSCKFCGHYHIGHHRP